MLPIPGRARHRKRIGDLAGAVDPTERAQHRGIETLRPDREPVDAGRGVGGKTACIAGAGIGLQRDFGIRGKVEQIARHSENARDLPGREETRRPAAKKDRGQRPRTGQRRFRAQVGDQGIGVVTRRQILLDLVRVEVAIGTLANTPRQMDIQPER